MDIFDLTGEKLREMRDQLGLSREKLAEMSGIGPRTIEEIEVGRSKNPGIETLKPILKALGVVPETDLIYRAQLIVDIVSRLSALDDGKLEVIRSLCDIVPAKVPPISSKSRRVNSND